MISEVWIKIVDNWERYLEALVLTLQLVGLSGALGFVGALGVAFARHSRFRFARVISLWFTVFFRGTPLLTQIFLLYFGSGQFQEWLERAGLWGFFREPFFCATLALTLNTAAYVGEILAGGIRALPAGEIDAARAFGLNSWQTKRKILLPRALRSTLPSLGNETVLLLKASSLVSTITLVDIMGLTREIVSETFAPIEFFLVAGLIYFVLIQATMFLFRRLERRWPAV